MDAASTLPTFYLLSAAAFGAALAAVSIGLAMGQPRFWDWIYAISLRRIMRDSMKSGDVREFRPRRSR